MPPSRKPALVNREPEGGSVSLRKLYSHSELTPLFAPNSVAVVGASVRPGSFGLRTLLNLTEYEGALYPINPKYQEVAGYACYPDIAALPSPPDCAVVAVSADLVAGAVRECVQAGVRGVIVYAGGFAETRQAHHVALQADLVDIVRGTPTRLLGPNCLGITNYARRARILFGRMPKTVELGAFPIAIACQSGSVSMSLGQVVMRGVSVSHCIPVGNGADVELADTVAYLAEDPVCRAIVCVFEGVPSPPRLIAAVRLATKREKPVIVYKMAVGRAGADAALSHTGALAGSHASYKAALEDAGAVVVDQMEDLIETALFFAKAGRPTGTGAAVVVSSGGLGVIAADKAEEFRVPLHQPTGRTLEVLRENVPEFGAARNPCDVTAQAMNDEGPLEACARAFLEDPVYSTMIVVHPYADEHSSRRVGLWKQLNASVGKVICSYWSTEWLEGVGARELEAEPGIAVFRSLSRCFAALAAWQKRERIALAKEHRCRISDAGAATIARNILEKACGALSDEQARNLLLAYGIPTAAIATVETGEEAAEAAGIMGYPVAVKIASPDILHKTDAGGVRLNLFDAESVEAAFADVTKNAEAVRARISGVVVQAMIPKGLEIMIGARMEPGFGPLLLVGFGGEMVEVISDVATRIAPVGIEEAKDMLLDLRSKWALAGFRGLPAVDLDRLGEVIVRFSELVADQEARLSEIDINPLICQGSRITAVDALIVHRTTSSQGDVQ